MIRHRLSSRTVRFISGIHFPPGVAGTANGDLYGIENTNRGCTLSTNYLPGQALNPSRSINGANFGLGIITGKADTNDSDPFAVNPGGVPLFHGGAVGGVGVVSTSSAIAEYAAYSGAMNSGLLPTPAQLPPPGVVIIGGIALPFVNQTTQPPGTSPGTFAGIVQRAGDRRHAAAGGISGRSECGQLRSRRVMSTKSS